MYQILQKFDIHWHDGGPSIAMMCHLRRVSDLLYNWKSRLLCYMKDVVLHCSIFFKWNKLVRVRVRVLLRLTVVLKEVEHDGVVATGTFQGSKMAAHGVTITCSVSTACVKFWHQETVGIATNETLGAAGIACKEECIIMSTLMFVQQIVQTNKRENI